MTVLRLAERILARGHRVTVFAHDEAAMLSAGTSEVAAVIAALLRRGVHGGTLDWVVEAGGAGAPGVGREQGAGIIPRGPADLVGFVREGDLGASVGVGG